jgi:phage gpG-like protein
MSDAFSLVLDDKELIDRLEEISRRVSDMTPAMLAIGELLTESTKQRFTDSEGPDGKRWKDNAPATVLAQLAKVQSSYKARRKASAPAQKRPLIDTGILQDTISYQVVSGGNGVEIGTNRFAGEWDGGAGVHHFGSRDGSIPARPFLGVSEDDRVAVLDVLSRFLDQSI